MGNKEIIAAVAAPVATVISTAIPLIFSKKDSSSSNISNTRNEVLQEELNNQRAKYQKKVEEHNDTLFEYDNKMKEQADVFKKEIEYMRENQNMRILQQNNQIQQLIEQQKQKENDYQKMLKNQELYFQNVYNILLSEKKNKEEILNQQMEQLKEKNNYQMEQYKLKLQEELNKEYENMRYAQEIERNEFIDLLNNNKIEYENSLKKMMEQKDEENEERMRIQKQQFNKVINEQKINNEKLIEEYKKENERIENEILEAEKQKEEKFKKAEENFIKNAEKEKKLFLNKLKYEMEIQVRKFISKKIDDLELKHLNNITELIQEEKYEYIYTEWFEIIFKKINEKLFSSYLNHLNVYIIGKTGVGKSTLINSILKLKENEKAKESLVEPCTKETKQYTSDEIPWLRLYDSRGIESKNFTVSEALKIAKKIIDDSLKKEDPDNQIHVIWYCLTGTRLEECEIETLIELKKVYEDENLPIIIIYTQAYLKNRVKIMKDLIIEKVKNIKNLNFIDIIAKKYEEEDLKREVRGLDELIELTKNKIKDAIHSALFSSFKKILRKEFEIITRNTLQKMQLSLPEKISQKFEELKIKRFNELKITKEIFMIIKECFMEYIKEKDIISNAFDEEINSFISKDFKDWLLNIRNLFKNKLKDEYKNFANKLYLLKFKKYNIYKVGETLTLEEEKIFNELNLEMNEKL